VTEAYEHMKSKTKGLCKICDMTLSSKETLYNHYLRYHLEENQKPKIDLPTKKDAFVKYDIMNEKDFKKTQRWPFVVYGDFKAYNYHIAGIENVSHQQVPNSYMLFSPDLLEFEDIVTEAVFRYVFSSNPDELLKMFVHDLMSLHSLHCRLLQRYEKCPELSPEEQERFINARFCESCKQEFTENNPKVRHHEYIFGKFVGVWCRKCNIHERKRNFKTTIVFHNFRGYDSHYIIRHAIREL
jgi:hypothetical protein